MFKQLLTGADIAKWPIAALLIFFSVMVVVIIWTFRPNSKQIYERIKSRSILDD